MNRDKSNRLHRKDEHISIIQKQRPKQADFSDIHFIHNCLPEINLNEVTISTSFLGKMHRSPLYINAVTGGTARARKINAGLAWAARQCGLPMAVGSQLAALNHPPSVSSFRIVRRVNPDGEIWANLGGYASLEQARRAVGMIDADALQIHLNIPQELAMREGDSCFQGILQRIAEIVPRVGVPVIVKEVGFGIAFEQARKLFETGVAAIDIGGRGGTNFLRIEHCRQNKKASADLLAWGIPSAISLIETQAASAGNGEIFAAGGMASALNLAKALALGARGAGLAAWPVYILLKQGRETLQKKIGKLEMDLRKIMVMAGAADISKLRRVPLVITGFTAEWLKWRGIDPGTRARIPEAGGGKQEAGNPFSVDG